MTRILYDDENIHITMQRNKNGKYVLAVVLNKDTQIESLDVDHRRKRKHTPDRLNIEFTPVDKVPDEPEDNEDRFGLWGHKVDRDRVMRANKLFQ